MKTNKTDKFNEYLTAAEMGKLWATYVGNTMGKCVLSYYLKNVGDKDIKAILEYALNLGEAFLKEVKAYMDKEGFPIPVGFTDDDVNLGAPRLFQDEFYLHYLKYIAKAGLSIYSAAVPLVTRKDISDFYIQCVSDTSNLLSKVNMALIEKGALMNSPRMAIPKKVDFINKQTFLDGVFDVRPLNGLEIGHLYGNINNDVTSKALIIGFTQVAKNIKVRKFLERGRDINHKHIELLSNKLSKDNLPYPSLLDHLVTTSTMSPFSDKLMIFHKIDMFSMKVREYANGASLSGRRDLGVLYARCLMDVSLYVEDGANIMIDNGWMEQPPLNVNRNELYTK